MNKTEVTFETDEEILSQAETIFLNIGLTLDETINIFLKKCIEVHGIPFEWNDIPNEETIKAIIEGERLAESKDRKSYKNAKDLSRDLDI
ncbi:MAG: type II toxin-antitoxin system RelB/DinJ family antitoxin [Coprobacillus sp.]|nr:type II toxin-antitoxin system RelB/DinJ family antitoxin [Coprobacillus sp.]